jgi:membrane protease YdiL (CAAX protease family)
VALAHVVQRITRNSISALEALISLAGLIPIGLFLGYVMLRTENIVTTGLVHTLADWVGTLG